MVSDVTQESFNSDFSLATKKFIQLEKEESRQKQYETSLLINYIGLTKTRVLTILGQKISAKEAKSWGLLNHSVDFNKLNYTVENLAKRLSELNPNAIICQKNLINSWIDNGPFEFVNEGISEICKIIIENKHYESKKANLIPNIFE